MLAPVISVDVLLQGVEEACLCACCWPASSRKPRPPLSDFLDIWRAPKRKAVTAPLRLPPACLVFISIEHVLLDGCIHSRCLASFPISAQTQRSCLNLAPTNHRQPLLPLTGGLRRTYPPTRRGFPSAVPTCSRPANHDLTTLLLDRTTLSPAIQYVPHAALPPLTAELRLPVILPLLKRACRAPHHRPSTTLSS